MLEPDAFHSDCNPCSQTSALEEAQVFLARQSLGANGASCYLCEEKEDDVNFGDRLHPCHDLILLTLLWGGESAARLLLSQCGC